MASLLWLLLVIGVYSAASDENSNSTPVSQFELAKIIYDKQNECDAIVVETIAKAVDKGDICETPKPDEKYFQCKKILDEKKRGYISTYLKGKILNKKSFTVELPEESVTLAVPTDVTQTSEVAQNEFDIQDELCATYDLCLRLSNMQVLRGNEEDVIKKKNSASRCKDFLDELKLKYNKVLDMSEWESDNSIGVLPAVCAYGDIRLTLPKNKNKKAAKKSPCVIPNVPKNDSPVEGQKGKSKQPVEESPVSVSKADTEKDDLNKNATSEEAKENSPDEGEDKPSKVMMNKTDDANAKHKIENPKMVKNVLPSVERSSELDSRRIVDESGSLSQKDNQPIIIETSKSNTKDSLPVTENKVKENVPQYEEAAKQSNYSTMKSEKTPKGSADENTNVVTYSVRVVSKNDDGKVMKIQASGQIKETENAELNDDDKEERSFAMGDEGSDDTLKNEPESNPTKVSEKVRRQRKRTLEENIILLENDCKELLEFGEHLMKHKILNSLVNLESHYNECIGKLNNLKKMYIDENQIDITSHKHIFPLTLPSGVQKLIPLPFQLINMDAIKTESNTNPNFESLFDTSEFFHNKQDSKRKLQNREPFDNPAFIQNFEFLESLKQESQPSGSSTLSKVASILHMNGGHDDEDEDD
ncbi:uncharacterized protein LOC128994625 [Macrosteles quadrilineatus]|uniref:uncharacterized protein LOC128994625 n=1 Tax=Macrosteles quadrilineatus TaxID=74068 RepID=UPI0023E1F813|nr:uncharacterized protein LOC128994625 [Macrosteles quadrilineatus]